MDGDEDLLAHIDKTLMKKLLPQPQPSFGDQGLQDLQYLVHLLHVVLLLQFVLQFYNIGCHAGCQDTALEQLLKSRHNLTEN